MTGFYFCAVTPNATNLQQMTRFGIDSVSTFSVTEIKRNEQDSSSPRQRHLPSCFSLKGQKASLVDCALTLVSKDRQLRTLENQLNKKDEQISNQNERMRETNILMKDLQQRLVIAAPAKPADIVIENDPEQETVTAAEPIESKVKRSIWKRSFNLFGRQS